MVSAPSFLGRGGLVMYGSTECRTDGFLLGRIPFIYADCGKPTSGLEPLALLITRVRSGVAGGWPLI
jgi:hypothetical protein